MNCAGALPLRSTIAPNDRKAAIAPNPTRNAPRSATGGKERNRGADTLRAVPRPLAVPRLDRAARTMCQVRPGARLGSQAVGMVGGEKPSQGRVVLHETPAA